MTYILKRDSRASRPTDASCTNGYRRRGAATLSDYSKSAASTRCAGRGERTPVFADAVSQRKNKDGQALPNLPVYSQQPSSDAPTPQVTQRRRQARVPLTLDS